MVLYISFDIPPFIKEIKMYLHIIWDGPTERVHIDLSSKFFEGPNSNGLLNIKDREPSELEKWSAEFPDHLDVLLAEKRVDKALASLDKGEQKVVEAACQPSTRGAELRAVILALKKLGDGQRAHSLLLLNAHFQRYQYNMLSPRPSITSYRGAYTDAISQLVFSAIAQTANDEARKKEEEKKWVKKGSQVAYVAN